MKAYWIFLIDISLPESNCRAEWNDTQSFKSEKFEMLWWHNIRCSKNMVHGLIVYSSIIRSVVQEKNDRVHSGIFFCSHETDTMSSVWNLFQSPFFSLSLPASQALYARILRVCRSNTHVHIWCFFKKKTTDILYVWWFPVALSILSLALSFSSFSLSFTLSLIFILFRLVAQLKWMGDIATIFANNTISRLIFPTLINRFVHTVGECWASHYKM